LVAVFFYAGLGAALSSADIGECFVVSARMGRSSERWALLDKFQARKKASTGLAFYKDTDSAYFMR
jgi:hypothetical protein